MAEAFDGIHRRVFLPLGNGILDRCKISSLLAWTQRRFLWLQTDVQTLGAVGLQKETLSGSLIRYLKFEIGCP